MLTSDEAQTNNQTHKQTRKHTNAAADIKAQTLYYFANGTHGAPPDNETFVATTLHTLLNVSGPSMAAPVKGFRLLGVGAWLAHSHAHTCTTQTILSLCLSASLPLCLSASLSLCLSVSLSLCLSVSLSLCLCLSLQLSLTSARSRYAGRSPCLPTAGLRDTAPTMLEPHGVPSGGDWALERLGAVFLENTEAAVVSGCHFSRIGGNGLMISAYNLNATVSHSEFAWMGGSAIAAWGWTDELSDGGIHGVDGTAGTFPRCCIYWLARRAA
eukprot:SAG22_NODE_237_length_14221_cov_37.207832_12_plen_270_part_00